MKKNCIFNELFVLELANNHWGKLSRGLKIIKDYGFIVKKNNIKATIKFQFRDVKKFIHPDYFHNTDLRYVDKTRKTMISWNEMGQMIKEVANQGMLTMATPFDEFSINKCLEFNLDLIKIASSDVKNKSFIRKIANIRKPVIASSGGCTLNDLDWIVNYFKSVNVPFALNHCVSLYPSEDNQLQLNQIDLLKKRYPETTIGFSSHEYNSWDYSMMIAYAKGARTFERHIDIDFENIPVSKYCSLPEQVDTWFKAFNKAKELCGSSSNNQRNIDIEESEYLDKLIRGVYVKKNISSNKTLTSDDVFFAIPKLKGQLSCQDFIEGINLGVKIKKNKPVMENNILSVKKQDLLSHETLAYN
jgi:sialic acid synthase SpsE